MANPDSLGLPAVGPRGRFCLLFAEDAIRLLYGDGIPTTGYKVKSPNKRLRQSSEEGAHDGPVKRSNPPKSGGGPGRGGAGVPKTCKKCSGPLVGHKKGQPCPPQASAAV